MEPLRPNDPSQLGDWSITQRLGEGEDSVIYLGVRGVAGSELAAIKLIEDDSFEFESALAKIRNEVEALRLLNDENIVKLIDANYEQGNLWIATEYIHGLTLDTKLKQTKKPLEELDWFNLAENIFHALEAAHAKGVIHKDIKPSNIILGEVGAKLIDFGISHVPERTRSATPGDFEGSRLFSAPENYNRKNIEEMDVFSAGVTLAYAAKLKSVWAGDNQDAITESIKNDSPDLSGLSELQQEFIGPLLEKLPIDRPSSKLAHMKAKEYIEYLVDKDQKSKPVAFRVKKSFARRLNRPIFKYGAPAVASALSLLMIISPWQATQDVINPSPSSTKSPTSESSINIVTPTPSSSLTTFGKSNSADCENAFVNATKTVDEMCLAPAIAGDLRSMFYLGRNASVNGRKADAEKWFLRAAAKQDVSSMGELAQIYLNANNSIKYKVWVKKCADFVVQTSAGARCKLLIGLDSLEANQVKEGILYLKDSVDFGNADAATVLGNYYFGIRENDLAITWYTKAAEMGDANGIDKLIRVARKLDKTAIYTKWLKISADRRNGLHAFILSMDYMLQEDYSNARKYAEIGSNAGDLNAMGVLGILFYKIDNDIPSAKIWLKRAAIGDDIDAINLLGLIARVEDKNLQDSISWYKKSVKLGSMEGGYWLGVVYAGGLNDGPNACSAFRGVIARADELKRLDVFDSNTMSKWLTQAQDGVVQTC